MYADLLGLYPGEQYVDYVGDALGGAGDFIDNYSDMRDANTIGGDKYFHCKANCEAAQRSEGGKDASQCISDSREWFDENIKGDPPSASSADQAANQYGRTQGAANPNGDCRQLCLPFRPNGLPPQY
jgi:primase-polymerase (primpol)-like protein